MWNTVKAVEQGKAQETAEFITTICPQHVRNMEACDLSLNKDHAMQNNERFSQGFQVNL
jgi:hypothetical protein